MGRPMQGSDTGEGGASSNPLGLIDAKDMMWGLDGETVTKSFIIDGRYSDGIKWQCFKDSKSTDRAEIEVISKTQLVFKIKKATKPDSGQYSFWCKELKFTTNVAVRIIDPPRWSQPTVATNKSNEVFVEWKPPTDPEAITSYDVEYREKEDRRWTKVASCKVTDSKFHDQDVVPNKVFSYRIFAYNKIGRPWVSNPSKDFPYQIVPVTEPLKIYLSRSCLQVNSGESLSLSVDITGDYHTIEWNKYGKNTPKSKVRSAFDKKTYKVHKATTEDAGKYEIVAFSDTESDTAYIDVDVIELPAPEIHFPSIKSLIVGEPLELCVDVHGDWDSITWEKAGTKLSKGMESRNKIYRKEQTTLDDSGEYVITAKNGDKSSEVKLKVEVREKQRKSTFGDSTFTGLLAALVMCSVACFLYEHRIIEDLKGEIEQLKRTSPVLSDINLVRLEIGIGNFSEELKNEWNEIKNRRIPDLPPSSVDQDLLVRLSKIEESVILLNERIGALEFDIKVLEKDVTNLKLDVEKLKRDVTDLRNDVSRAFKYIEELNESLIELKEYIESIVKKLWEAIEALQKTVSDNDEKMTDEFKNYKNFSQSLESRLVDVNNATENLKKVLGGSQEVIDLLRSNALHRNSLLVAFGILVVSGCAIVIWVYQISCEVKSSRSRDDPNARMSSVQVMKKIPRSVTLEQSVGIIGFSNSMSGFHRSLMETALRGRNLTLTVISQHNQLLRLPPCQLYVMCVEFTERHVIIEEQGLGLGDLKRCTHDAIRQMGADLVIIYTRDPGSRSLPQGYLFNNKIYCVSSQPELIALGNQNRFLSIYDKMSEVQRNSLLQTVNTCLRTRL